METIRLEEPCLVAELVEPSANLVLHNNPFDPMDISTMYIAPGESAYSMLSKFNYDVELYDITISKNQEILDTDFIVEDKDVISFLLVPRGGSGGGQKILGAVLIVIGAAINYFSFGSLSWIGTPMMKMGVGLFISGMIMNMMGKPNIPTLSLDSYDNSTTYGWDVSGNYMGQGNAVPILYGTTRITPQYIGKYLKIENNVQILKLLLGLGEGVLDYITGIQVNDLDMSSYTNISYDQRLGTNNQTIIEDFNDTWTDQSVNKKLTDNTTWQYATTSGDSVSSITVGLTCPQGLYYANDAGGLDPYTITIDLEYKRSSSSTWLNFPNSGYVRTARYWYVDLTPPQKLNAVKVSTIPTADLTGPFAVYKQVLAWFLPSPIEYVGQITTLPADVTAHTIWPITANVWDSSAQYAWTKDRVETLQYQYIPITGEQTSSIRRAYSLTGLPPGKYDVRARFYSTPNASSRYMSTTYLDFLQEAVSDDFTYPNTGLLALSVQATDQLNGGIPKVTCVASRTSGYTITRDGFTFTLGRLDNPAWASLDLLINTRYGAGVSLDRIDFQSFSDWATYCTTNNYTINLYVDQLNNLSDNLQVITQLGRGTVIQYGSRFKALVDKADIMVTQGFLFSMGNIIQDSFSEVFLPLKDRANIIEVTYYDKDNDYDRTTIEVSQGNYDLINQVNKTSINLLGCTTKEQALRHAKFLLNQNRYLTITASWEASIDSIHCNIADIVNVAHDVPQWGYSGRIISNTSNTITIDRDDLVFNVGTTYYIQVSDANTDEQVYKQVLDVTGDVITITTSDLPVLGDYSVYAYGEINRHAKKMRILSISTANDLKRKITAIEYNENVYNDNVTVPTPIYVSDLGVKYINISEYLVTAKDGKVKTVVDLSWSGASFTYNVYYKKQSDTSFSLAGVATGSTYSIDYLVDGVTYDFKVNEVSTSYTVLGKTVPPPDVTNISGTESGNIFTISWDYLYKPLDFKEFIIYNTLGIEIGRTTTNSFITPVITTTDTEVTFIVKAIDTTGNLGNPISIIVPITPIPPVTLVTSSLLNGVLDLSWSYTKMEDFSSFEVYDGLTYIGSSTETTFKSLVHAYTTGVHTLTVYVKDTAGNLSTGVTTDITVVNPIVSNASHSFNTNMLTIKWDVDVNSYPIKEYIITSGTDTYKSTSPSITFPAIWLGNRNITILVRDTASNTHSIVYGINIAAPSAPVIISTISLTSGIEFSWAPTAGTVGTKEYIVEYAGNYTNIKDAYFFVQTKLISVYTINVIAVDYAGNTSIAGSKSVTISPPSISNISSTTSGRLLTLLWDTSINSFGIKDYVIEYIDGFSIAKTSIVTTATFSVEPNWIGSKTFTITPRDLAGNSGTAVQYNSMITAPMQPVVTSSIVGKDLVLSITNTPTSFALDYVQISYDSTVLSVASTIPTWSIPIFWDLSKDFLVAAVDVLGNMSTIRSTSIVISEGTVSSLFAEVIDNNVMLRWSATDGTLPIEHFKILKGNTYATAVEIGIRKGTFTTVFESESGVYTYWVVPVDTAGNEGVYAGVQTSVSQPPDFILNVDWNSNWSGTKTNIKVDDSGLRAGLPVNTTQTYQSHFDTYTWTTPNAQVVAGYPIWLTPSTSTASYSQTFDYGVTLGSTSVTLTDPIINKAGTGTYTMSRQLSTSADGVAWVDAAVNAMQIFVTNIRYVKVVYNWTVDTNTLLDVGNFNLRLDSKVISDSGSGTAVATDVGGTTATFNAAFVDVVAISVTPQVPVVTSTGITGSGTIATATFVTRAIAPFIVGAKITVSGATPSGYNGTFTVTACTTSSVSWASTTTGSATVQGTISCPTTGIYDFVDVANPTSFKVILYDLAGTRINGNFSWSARGY